MDVCICPRVHERCADVQYQNLSSTSLIIKYLNKNVSGVSSTHVVALLFRLELPNTGS